MPILTDGSVPGFVGRNGRLPSNFNGAGWAQFLDADGDGDADLYYVLEVRLQRRALDQRWLGAVYRSAAGGCAGPTLCAVQGSLVLDINQDGLDDIVLADDAPSGSGISRKKLQILISNGDGTFRDETNNRLPPQSTVGIGPFGSTGDIDGDHLADLLVIYMHPTSPERLRASTSIAVKEYLPKSPKGSSHLSRCSHLWI